MAAGTLKVEIVSPNGSVFKGQARGVKAPGVQGSFEVLYDHAPMLAAFDIGVLQVTSDTGGKIEFATSGGFLEVVNNHVTVLAETAEPANDIDVDRAKEAEQRALEALQHSDPEERAALERKLERARNRARLAMGQVGSR